jgi:hypothetical protein
MTDTTTLSAILSETESSLSCLSGQMDQAEEEITRAQREHPGMWDVLYHSFSLLTPTHDRMSTGFVFRAHCRELLTRVMNGEDTRPGTTAEVACMMSDMSKLAPFTTAATGLYFRMWEKAGFPPLPGNENGEILDLSHYEAIAGSRIDDHEALARKKLSQPDRRLSIGECGGWHHGHPAPRCRFYRKDAANAAA